MPPSAGPSKKPSTSAPSIQIDLLVTQPVAKDCADKDYIRHMIVVVERSVMHLRNAVISASADASADFCDELKTRTSFKFFCISLFMTSRLDILAQRLPSELYAVNDSVLRTPVAPWNRRHETVSSEVIKQNLIGTFSPFNSSGLRVRLKPRLANVLIK